MTETLAELFQKAKNSTIELDNQLIYAILKIKIDSPKNFIIYRLNASSPPLQGLRLKADKGSIQVNGQTHPEIILWADTSPDVVSISVIPKRECELKIWNVWKSGASTEAWVGNAGFLVSKIDNVISLECSHGLGDINFSNLVIKLEEI